MKRYHVISISVLLGLIAGLSVSGKATANTLVCTKAVVENQHGSFVDNRSISVSTVPGKATITIDGDSEEFAMKRIINEGWKADSKSRLYQGTRVYNDGKEMLSIVMLDDPKNPLTVAFEGTGKQGKVSVIAMDCKNFK